MAMDVSENIFILSAVKSSPMDSGIIHSKTLFNTFLSLKCQKAQKNGDFGPKNSHFGFENGHGSFQKYFHLIGSEIVL